MSWDARQRRMLAEMGLRTWVRAEESDAPAEAQVASKVAVAEPTVPVSTPPRAAPRATPGIAGRQAAATPVSALAAPELEPDDEDRRHRIAAMDLPALRAAVAACTACGLCQGRRNTVFGAGEEGAHWMVVGEAPGEQEDEAGEPFVGKSGQLLDAMLRALNLGRGAAERAPEQQVFIANAVKCRPPNNRNPSADEVARCEPFLRRQIELVQPRIVLALGRFAVKALLGTDEALGRLRGRVHRHQGLPLIVSYHPAYLLRQPADKARAWDDLCLARETLLAGAPPPPP